MLLICCSYFTNNRKDQKLFSGCIFACITTYQKNSRIYPSFPIYALSLRDTKYENKGTDITDSFCSFFN